MGICGEATENKTKGSSKKPDARLKVTKQQSVDDGTIKQLVTRMLKENGSK